MHRYTIGIDNGSTGSIAIIQNRDQLTCFQPAKTILTLSPGKSGKKLMRLDREWFRFILNPLIPEKHKMVYIERPFTGSPMMAMATIAAARFYEATICTMEDLGFGYEVVDSRTWQKQTFGKTAGRYS